MAEARADVGDAIEPCGPWNPGLGSQLTPELWRMCTIFRPQNVFTTYQEAVELRELTGLSLPQLVAFRPERMVLHDVLVRVSADYEVPDPHDADVRSLGANFRRITQALLQRHVMPRMDWLTEPFPAAREAIATIVARELRIAFGRSPDKPQKRGIASPRSLLARLRGTNAGPGIGADSWSREHRLIERWQAAQRGDPMEAALYGAMVRVISAVHAVNGRLWGDPKVLEALVTGLACNAYVSELIAERVGPLLAEGAEAEHIRALPVQEHPIAMSTKGASAAGKSTMRPMQRALASRMGADWRDFALVSPDIFRRDLLDVDSLGGHYKYFGTFTSHELDVVDQKLDHHLAKRAELHGTPHLLFDRFRFDSFGGDSEEQLERVAILRKRRLLHYLFMITPPEKTVERAWQRGLEIGRYKAVDDLLAHNVEAYAGMQSFFLARAVQPGGLNQHYEFLDNDVPFGDVPLSVAFGWNGELNIVDVKRLVDMDRYSKINVDARRPEDLYANPQSFLVEHNVDFLRTCLRRFPVLNLARRDTGLIYARFDSGRLAWQNSGALDAIDDAQALAALRVVAPELFASALSNHAVTERYLDPSRYLTLGQWGKAAAQAIGPSH